MGVVLTLPKEKKKKEEPAVIVDRDKIHVMPNSPTFQSSHLELEQPPMLVYYPSGQRILKKKGYDEYNYENYMKVFGKHINSEDLSIMEGDDAQKKEELKSSKDWWFSICKTGHNISLKILGAIIVLLVITIPFSLLVKNENSIVDISLLKTFIVYAIIIAICFFIATIVFEVLKIRLGRQLEGMRLAQIE